jgi:hypothetical protein
MQPCSFVLIFAVILAVSVALCKYESYVSSARQPLPWERKNRGGGASVTERLYRQVVRNVDQPALEYGIQPMTT